MCKEETRSYTEYQYKCLKCNNVISTIQIIGLLKVYCFKCKSEGDYEFIGKKKRSYKIKKILEMKGE